VAGLPGEATPPNSRTWFTYPAFQPRSTTPGFASSQVNLLRLEGSEISIAKNTRRTP